MQKVSILHYLHLNLSTSRPSHNVDKAVFTDNTRILPTPSLKVKKKIDVL